MASGGPPSQERVGHGLGPFGFEKGMTREQIIAIVGKDDVTLSKGIILDVTTAPKPHPDFNRYILLISPDKGLLKVGAYGRTIETGDSGFQLQTAFKDTVDAITQKYGSPRKVFDTCSGSDVECSLEGDHDPRNGDRDAPECFPTLQKARRIARQGCSRRSSVPRCGSLPTLGEAHFQVWPARDDWTWAQRTSQFPAPAETDACAVTRAELRSHEAWLNPWPEGDGREGNWRERRASNPQPPA
jgi:hypothetical protein